MCASGPVLAEYEELLLRESYPLGRCRARLLLQKIRTASDIVVAGGSLAIAHDPDDNIFLECAQAAKAHYLVTGNLRHFPRGWKYTKVITPRTFINIWTDLHPDTQDE
jgi:uncharacterized protein